MGWWSCTVCGGDEPMDYLDEMEDIIGLPTFNEDTDEPIKYTLKQQQDAVNKNINKLVKCADKKRSEIAFQMLGVVIITNGAKMTASLRDMIIASIKCDEWAYESAERKAYMNSFKRQVQRYPLNQNNRRRTIAYEGLFDKLLGISGN